MVNSETRRSIEIYKEDFDYLDAIRETGYGKVSFSNIVKKVCANYRTVIE